LFAIEVCSKVVYVPAPNATSRFDGMVPALQTPVVVIHVRLLAFSEPHNKQQRLHHSLSPPHLVTAVARHSLRTFFLGPPYRNHNTLRGHSRSINMTRAKKKTVKKREAFVAHKPPEKDKACTEAATEAAAEAAARLRAEVKRNSFYRRTRLIGMIQQLLGLRPNFAGKVTIPERDIATTEDYLRVEDIRGDLVIG
jgi:hypothetical protein